MTALQWTRFEVKMNIIKDLSGQKFGRLTVIERDLQAPKGRSKWICRCDCGNTVSVLRNHLVSGGTISCGCALKGVNLKPLSPGQRFWRLEVVEMTSKKSGNTYIYKCKCDCGNTCFASRAALVNGYTKSCGCLQREKARERFAPVKSRRDALYIDGTDIVQLMPGERKSNTSGKRGVSWDSSVGTWRADIGFKGKRYRLGSSRDFDTAVSIREEAEKALHGNFLEWYAKAYPEQWEKINRKKK